MAKRNCNQGLCDVSICPYIVISNLNKIVYLNSWIKHFLISSHFIPLANICTLAVSLKIIIYGILFCSSIYVYIFFTNRSTPLIISINVGHLINHSLLMLYLDLLAVFKYYRWSVICMGRVIFRSSYRYFSGLVIDVRQWQRIGMILIIE